MHIIAHTGSGLGIVSSSTPGTLLHGEKFQERSIPGLWLGLEQSPEEVKNRDAWEGAE